MTAHVQILVDHTPYLMVEVAFGEFIFDQWIITEKTGAELNIQLQLYADDYMSEWFANLT